MEPPLCVVSNWIERVYTILVWNTISGSSNLDICCYHCLIFTLIFHLKVLINFFFFIIFIIIIINSIIGIITTTTTTTITITIIISSSTTTSIIIIIIIIIIVVVVVVVVVVVIVIVIVVTIVVVLLLFITYTINLSVVRPRSCRVIITSTLLHLGEDINLLVVSSFGAVAGEVNSCIDYIFYFIVFSFLSFYLTFVCFVLFLFSFLPFYSLPTHEWEFGHVH